MFCCGLASAQGQPVSPFKQGQWIKLAILKEGIYQLDRTWLQKQGLDTKNLRTDQLALYTDPRPVLPQINADLRASQSLVEVPILVQGAAEGPINGQHRFYFYAPGPHPILPQEGKQAPNFTWNPYSDSCFYFLRVDAPSNFRVRSMEMDYTKALYPMLEQGQSYFRKKEEKYNLIQSGRAWVGELLTAGNKKIWNLSLPGFVPNTALQVELQVHSTSINPILLLSSLGNRVDSLAFDGLNSGRYEIKAQEKWTRFKALGLGNVDKADLNFQAIGNGGSTYLSELRWQYPSSLGFQGNFHKVSLNLENPGVFRFLSKPWLAQGQIWELGKEIRALPNGSAQVQVALQAQSTLVFWDPKQSPFPIGQGRINPIDLSQGSVPSHLILFHPKFKSAALALAAHRNRQGLASQAISIQDVFLTYAGGRPDPSAIKHFLFDLKSKPNSPLRYLVLLGDASWDPKQRSGIGTREERNSILPTYSSLESFNPLTTYASDDFYALLESNEGAWPENWNAQEESLDLAIGRIPAKTQAEADIYVQKLMDYESKPKPWPSTMALFADDSDAQIHQQDALEFAQSLQTSLGLRVEKVLLDQYPQTQSNGQYQAPLATEKIKRLFEREAQFIHFIGHGSENGWTDEKVLTTKELLELNNQDNLPILFTATCQFARLDNPGMVSGAELALLSKTGGAIAVISPSRPVYQSSNYAFSKAFYAALLKHRNSLDYRLGDWFKDGKNAQLGGVFQRNLFLLGDPALPLPWQGLDLEAAQQLVSDGPNLSWSIENKSKLQGKISILAPKVKTKTLGTKTEPFSYEQEGLELMQSNWVSTNGKTLLPSNLFLHPILQGKKQVEVLLQAKDDQGKPYLSRKTLALPNIHSSPNAGITRIVWENAGNWNKELIFFLENPQGLSWIGANGEKAKLSIGSDWSIPIGPFLLPESNLPQEARLSIPRYLLPEGKNTATLRVYNTLGIAQSLDFLLDVSEEKEAPIALDVFPNPFKEQVFLRMEKESPWETYTYNLSLFSLNGQRLGQWEGEIKNQSTAVPITLFQPENGFFFLRIEIFDSSGRLQLVKTKKLIHLP